MDFYTKFTPKIVQKRAKMVPNTLPRGGVQMTAGFCFDIFCKMALRRLFLALSWLVLVFLGFMLVQVCALWLHLVAKLRQDVAKMVQHSLT